jgi:hypothetical protein
VNIGFQVFIGLLIGNVFGEAIVSWLSGEPYNLRSLRSAIFDQSAAIAIYAYALS